MVNNSSSSSLDRYSRLTALKEYGFDINFKDLQQKSVVFCGVGGIGSLSAEILVRCGIGHVYILDFDEVAEENLNRVFYKIKHIGLSKAEVCAKVLRSINPDVKIDFNNTDIMDINFEGKFEQIIKQSDLVMMGLDNIPARQYVNVKCIKMNVPLMDAGALRSGLGGYVHLVIPGKTACYQCTGSVKIQVKANDARGPQCAASLPTTITMISSLQTQQSLKYLLNFGRTADFINYNGLLDQFVELKLPRDPNCYVCSLGKRNDNSEIWIDANDTETETELKNLIKEIKEKEKLIRDE